MANFLKNLAKKDKKKITPSTGLVYVRTLRCAHSSAHAYSYDDLRMREPLFYSNPDDLLALRSVVVIQRWYRKYLERLAERRAQTWSIFESLEYSNEQDQTRLYNFFNDMLMQVEAGTDTDLLRNLGIIQRHTTQNSIQADIDEDAELCRATNPDDIKVEKKYKGLHITIPMTKTQLHQMITAFKQKKEIHAKYVLLLLHEVRKQLKKQKNINRISTLSSKRMTVIGDLHGKLDDLFIIFFKNGLPSDGNPYLFNGDFVDRGAESLEVILLIFCTFLVNPNSVYFNRGNHEDYVMNLRYGFAKEVMTKHTKNAGKIVRLFQDVFSWLPLVTIIDNKIWVSHGGISDQTSITYIEKINRHKYLSILRPPVDEDENGVETVDGEEWRQLLDLMWSDPKSQNGCTANNFRGGGVNWGPDITKAFLKQNKLSLIIRSHECKPEGYEYTHDDKVLTLFSSSNYYEVGSNKGAFAQLFGVDRKPNVIQYIHVATNLERKMTIKQRVNTVEDSAIKGLRKKILSHQSQLIAEFKKEDVDKKGEIKVLVWCKIMGEVLNMDLPWRSLAHRLVTTDNSIVKYGTMFDDSKIELDIGSNIDDEVRQSFTETMYRNRDNLETIFRAIDKDNSGRISMDEFAESCSILARHTGQIMSRKDIRSMAQAIDINKDGQIDFNEFLEAFRIVDNEVNKDPSTVARCHSSCADIRESAHRKIAKDRS